MAEALLRHYAGERFEVLSAGIDPSGLQAKGLDGLFAKVSITYAIIVCDQAEDTCQRRYPSALQTLH
jgi:hypothetical protein